MLVSHGTRLAATEKPSATDHEIDPLETIAAIAAGMFAVLDPAPGIAGNSDNAAASSGPAPVPSNWKQKGRSEALR